MVLLRAYGLDFEDFVKDEYGTWSYICKEHADWVPDSQLDAEESDCLCGVVGCKNTTAYYVNFEEYFIKRGC